MFVFKNTLKNNFYISSSINRDNYFYFLNKKFKNFLFLVQKIEIYNFFLKKYKIYLTKQKIIIKSNKTTKNTNFM